MKKLLRLKGMLFLAVMLLVGANVWAEEWSIDLASVGAAHADKAPVTISDAVATIDGTDMGTCMVEDEALNANFVLQTGTAWLMRQAEGLYQFNSGGRGMGMLNCTKGQIITIVGTGDPNPSFNVTLESQDGNTYKYVVNEDGNVKFTPARYLYFTSVSVENPEGSGDTGAEDPAIAELKAALNMYIDMLDGQDLSDYTDESAAALTEAIEKAKAAVADPNATEESLMAAYLALGAALEGLEEKPAVDEGTWEKVGTAILEDPWVLPGLGIDQHLDANKWEVPLERNSENKNLYRLVDPYHAEGPVKAYNESEEVGYITFDVTDPDHVVFSITNAGFANSTTVKPKVNVFYAYNQFGRQVAYGNSLTDVIKQYGEDFPFTTFKDNVITLGEGDACYGEQSDKLGGYDWEGPDMTGTITLKIVEGDTDKPVATMETYDFQDYCIAKGKEQNPWTVIDGGDAGFIVGEAVMHYLGDDEENGGIWNNRFAYEYNDKGKFSMRNKNGQKDTTCGLFSWDYAHKFSILDLKDGDQVIITIPTGEVTFVEDGEKVVTNQIYTITTTEETTRLDLEMAKSALIAKIRIVPNGAELVPTITLDKSELTLEAGATAAVKATVDPAMDVKWKSSDEAVATVANGTITAVAAGEAEITCYWESEVSETVVEKSLTVTVTAPFVLEGDLIKEYDFTAMGDVTLVAGEAAGKIWNAAQTNWTANTVYYCTNEGLEKIAVQAVLNTSDKKGWSIVDGKGLYEGSGAGRCAAVGGIKAGQIVEFFYTGANFYTIANTDEKRSEDAGIDKELLLSQEGRIVFKAEANGMIGFELDKGNYVQKINIYNTDEVSDELDPCATPKIAVSYSFEKKDGYTVTITSDNTLLVSTDGTTYKEETSPYEAFVTETTTFYAKATAEGYAESEVAEQEVVVDLDSSKPYVAYVYDKTYSSGVIFSEEKIVNALKADYNVIEINYTSTTAPSTDLLNADLVISTEAMAGNTTLSNGMLTLVGQVPMIALKAFNYTSGRWSWGTPSNPTPAALGFTPKDEEYKVLEGVTLEADGTVQLATETSTNAVQTVSFSGAPADMVVMGTVGGDDAAAAMYASNAQKFFGLGLSSDCWKNYTDNAGIIIKNAAAILIAGGDLTATNGVVDGINAINAEVENGAIYNLQGQKVEKAQKGLYIINGKKVVIK